MLAGLEPTSRSGRLEVCWIIQLSYSTKIKVELHFIAVNSTTNMALWWDSNLSVIVV